MGIEDFIKDSQILKDFLVERSRLIMVIGGSDTGKTTLVEGLAAFLSSHKRTAVVDLDMGQSRIGVPTTVSWGVAREGFKGLTGVEEEGFYFTGALSPPGNLLPSIVGARKLADRALRACDKLIVDTTGLIEEPAGRALKRYKIDILRPDIIIGLERENELSHILDPLRFQKRHIIRSIPVPDKVKSKSRIKRAEWRTERFRGYFASSRVIEVSLDNTGVEFTRQSVRTGLKGRIVSFRDALNEDMSLGIIEGADFRKKRLLIRSPISPSQEFTSIVIGSYIVDSI